MKAKPDLSVIILLEEEHEDFAHFLAMLHDTIREIGMSCEILIIANGTERFLKAQISDRRTPAFPIRAISFPNQVSQAVCVRSALKESRSDLILTCGAYQQIDSDSLKAVLTRFDNDTDMLIPWRQNRVDPSFNQFQSRLFNGIVTAVTRNEFHDLSCTLRLQRRQVLEEVRIYGNMYRFLPPLAKQRGFRVREIKCDHFQERGKTGFYRVSEYLVRLLDILTLFFNIRYGRKPLRFFILLGALFFAIGISICFGIAADRFLFGIPIGNRFELLIAVAMMVLGVQAAGVGLLAEIVTFVLGRQRKEYTIEETI
jgi:hypothetical protein